MINSPWGHEDKKTEEEKEKIEEKTFAPPCSDQHKFARHDKENWRILPRRMPAAEEDHISVDANAT